MGVSHGKENGRCSPPPPPAAPQSVETSDVFNSGRLTANLLLIYVLLNLGAVLTKHGRTSWEGVAGGG